MYLDPAEYAAYGIPDATDAQVASAGRSIDAALGRPEGLLWMPDATGEPGWMGGMTPTRGYALPSAIAPGSLIAITFPYARFGAESIGEVVILDRGDPGKAEACVVAAASGNTITLQAARFAHDIGATIEFGLTIRQEARGPIRIDRSPVARIFSAQGRHSYRRELDRLGPGCDDIEALLVTNYGQNGVSGWNALDTTAWDLDASTGSIRAPLGGYDTVRLQYVAGWSRANIPAGIKQAVATIVTNAAALGAEGISGNIKLLKSGDATIERFAGVGGGSSLLDGSIMSLIAPYRIYRL